MGYWLCELRTTCEPARHSGLVRLLLVCLMFVHIIACIFIHLLCVYCGLVSVYRVYTVYILCLKKI